MNVWIGNIAPGTSEDEIRAFLVKYGFPEYTGIQHEPGDGSRPAAVVSFEGVGTDVLRQLAQRVHGIYWKERKLNVQAV